MFSRFGEKRRPSPITVAMQRGIWKSAVYVNNNGYTYNIIVIGSTLGDTLPLAVPW